VNGRWGLSQHHVFKVQVYYIWDGTYDSGKELHGGNRLSCPLHQCGNSGHFTAQPKFSLDAFVRVLHSNSKLQVRTSA